MRSRTTATTASRPSTGVTNAARLTNVATAAIITTTGTAIATGTDGSFFTVLWRPGGIPASSFSAQLTDDFQILTPACGRGELHKLITLIRRRICAHRLAARRRIRPRSAGFRPDRAT